MAWFPKKIHHLYEKPTEITVRAILASVPERELSYGELRDMMPKGCMSSTLVNLLVVMSHKNQIVYKHRSRNLNEMVVSLPD